MTAVDYDDIYEEFLLLTSSSDCSSSSASSPSQVEPSTRQRRNPSSQQRRSNLSNMSDGSPIFPGGLEVLWREVPVEFQRIISPYDVPDSARFRGYFTVQELLTLKRTLAQRHNAIKAGAAPCLRRITPSSTAISAAAASAQATSIMSANVGLGVGAVVKEAMEVLDEPQQQQSNQLSSNINCNMNNQLVPTLNPSLNQQQPNPMSRRPATLNGMTSQQPQQQSNQAGPPETSTNNHTNQNQQQIQRTLRLGPNGMGHQPGHMSCTVNEAGEHISITPDIKHIVGPPPYRTATLVFKLLQIGNYQLRSFSEVNPNRLRVLFNTQRLSYECQLPVVQTTARDSIQPLRKILTIEVGFEQISVMKFGPDKLQLRVEGPPCLTVTYSPSNEEPHQLQLSQQDQYLLDQIDKGQLKLNPHHQLFFINERLVNLLESQFREHPRFSYLIAESQEYRTY